MTGREHSGWVVSNGQFHFTDGGTHDQSQEMVKDRNGTGNDPRNEPQDSDDCKPDQSCRPSLRVEEILSFSSNANEDVFLRCSEGRTFVKLGPTYSCNMSVDNTSNNNSRQGNPICNLCQ